MSKSFLPIAILVLVGGVVWLGWGRAGGEEVDFNRDIRPILNERCVRWIYAGFVPSSYGRRE